MDFFFKHLERLQGKPHHVRKRVAFSIAGGITAVIALVWLVGSVRTGIFALQETSPAEEAAAQQPASLNLAGAAAALPVAGEKADPAHIEIVDTASSTGKSAQAEQTVIPF